MPTVPVSPLVAESKAVDPLVSLRFAVEVDGIEQAAFSECSGLAASVTIDKWQEGGANDVTLKFPGRVDFENITLKRGIAHSTDLYKWFLAVVQRGKLIRRKVTIKLLEPAELRAIRTWTCLNAFPVKWSAPSLQVSSNTVAIESLEFAHEGIIEV